MTIGGIFRRVVISVLRPKSPIFTATFDQILKNMKRRALTLSVILLSVFVIFRFCNSKPEEVKNEKETPLSVAENSGPFNQSFNSLLNSYLSLKEALVESDSARANQAALQLRANADSLRVDQIHGDTSGTIKETAEYFRGTIHSSAEALAQDPGLENKRKEFEMITDALWSLTRTVKYGGQKVYYQYCPMAFDNKGAYWISDKRDIRNPYFGDKMLKCGEVADSLDYSKR
jgi:hypothetical protein